MGFGVGVGGFPAVIFHKAVILPGAVIFSEG
jgi:hypothetical protein